jgi:ankyrin repeat protein
LLSKGANPNIADINRVTPLHLAAKYVKDMNLIDLLLNHPDVDVNLMDNEGKNALDYARENKEGNGERIGNRLKEKGAVESEYELPKGNKESLKKLMRGYKNRKPNEIENFSSLGGTIPTVDENARINEELFLKTFCHPFEKGENISSARGKFGENALHVASLIENTEFIDVILETGKFDINVVDDKGNTPLHYAIIGTNRKSNARHLIQKGADPNIADQNGITPLHLAAFHAKEIETISLILENEQVDINSRSNTGWTALHNAIQAQNVEIATCLLEKKADPTVRAENGITPLHMAAQHLTDTDILNLLLESGKVDINETTELGITALHWAAMESNKATVEFLLSKGANPNVTTKYGRTPLHVAAWYAKEMDIVELLLNHPDVNVNLMDDDGRNALHYSMDNKQGVGKAIVNLLKETTVLRKAEGRNHEPENIAALVNSSMETIRLLIKNGQDIIEKTWGENGANALHLAAANEKTADLIDAILETVKFDINGVDINGRTPLHYAMKRPDPVLINARRLIEMGADPSVPDKNGVTPLHMAARNAKSMDLIELLLNTKKLDVTDCDDNGLTACDYARYNKHGLGDTIVDRLTKHLLASRIKVLVCIFLIFCCGFLLAFYIVEA